MLRIASRHEARTSWRALYRPAVAPELAVLGLPIGLLFAGALVALPFSLDPAVAWQRIGGLVVAAVAGGGAFAGLRRAPGRVLPTALLAVAAVALGAGAWVIAASGPGIFRGPLGEVLDRLAAPLFGRVRLTDPVAVTNTRFIVGYNGLADLSLLAVWACAAVLFGQPPAWARRASVAIAFVAGVVLVGTGSRGALAGLLAGLVALGLFGWRRGWLLALATAPALAAMARTGLLDKGFELSSTLGRLAFWQGYLRLLAEFPLTGVGLGQDTANRVALFYEVNPDPERIAYAHNTFIQTYMEQGPLGLLGMVLLPALALLAAALARQAWSSPAYRGLLLGALGLLVGLEVHGLTDQVVTTDVGTLLVVVSVAAILAACPVPARVATGRTARAAGIVVVAGALVIAASVAVLPGARAQLLLNVGSLQLTGALLRGASPDRAGLDAAESTFQQALQLDPTSPALLRGLAWAKLERYDAAGALNALQAAVASPRLDAFDMLQVAHVYRELGFADEAYTWAKRAFERWGRPPPEPVLATYKRATLADNPPAIVLAEQGEAAMRARKYADALRLFREALGLAPSNGYLQERVGDAERAVRRYGPNGAAG